MLYPLKQFITAFAMASSMALVHADVTVNTGGSYNGASLQPSNALTWRSNTAVIDALNAVNITLTALQTPQPAAVKQTTVYDPDLEEDVRDTVAVIAPISAINVSETTNQITSIATSGGVTLTAPKAAGVSLGGSLTIANLQVDLTGKRIYADITGNFTGASTGTAGISGGAITTLTSFYLWDFSTASGDQGWPGNSQLSNLTFSQLIPNTNSVNHIISALRLHTTGIGALKAVSDFGSLTTPVPEASSGWMVIGGLITMSLWASRDRLSQRHRPVRCIHTS